MSNETFVIVDGHAVIYRAYHAFQELSTSEGIKVNAVYGFARIVLKTLRDEMPKYVAVTFDHPKKTFRHEQFKEYKAHRPEMPDDLKSQISLVKEFVEALNIPQFELAGYEADDIIGTIAHNLNSNHKGLTTLIVTGDRDAFQLVSDRVHVVLPTRAKNGNSGEFATEYDRDAVFHKMSVWPEQIIDLKALMGDASDNIPGVAGVGEVSAVKLLQAAGNLKVLYEAVRAVTEGKEVSKEGAAVAPLLKGSLLAKLQAGEESAKLSQELATINTSVPIDFDLESCAVNAYDKEKAAALLNKFEFKSLIPLLPFDDFEMQIQQELF